MYAVIMAGGQGTRLWPMSRKKMPKQFIPLVTEDSSFQETFKRLASALPRENIFVQAGGNLSEVVFQQSGISPLNFIEETEMRDNGPAIILAAIKIALIDKDATLAIIWADHNIKNVQAFVNSLKVAEKSIAKYPDSLVTIGVNPTSPDTGFGYIKIGKQLNNYEEGEIFHVNEFIEKPDLATAIKFIKDWRYLWNTGYKIFRAQWMIDKFLELYPEYNEAVSGIREALENNDKSKLTEEYRKLPKESIEYLITEKTDKILAIPANLEWADVGNWQVLHDILSENFGDTMVVRGNHIGHNDENCLILADHKLIATVGLKDIIVVDTPDILMICNKNNAQDIKKVVDKLKDEGKHLYL